MTAKGRNPTGPMNPAMLSWEAFDAAESAFPDGNISAHAVAALSRIKTTVVDRGGHFFLGVGFLKPHLPQVRARARADSGQSTLSLTRLRSLEWPPLTTVVSYARACSCVRACAVVLVTI